MRPSQLTRMAGEIFGVNKNKHCVTSPRIIGSYFRQAKLTTPSNNNSNAMPKESCSYSYIYIYIYIALIIITAVNFIISHSF